MSNQELQDQKERLSKRKNALLERQKKIHRYYYLCLALGVVFISVGLGQLATYILIDTEFAFVIFGIEIPKSLCLILLIYGTVMVVALAPMARTRLRFVEEEIRDIEFEKDLLMFETKPEESRAEKLLRMSQYQLRRYYDLNLSQNYWIFVVGIFCIFLGVSIIGVTLYLLTSPSLTPALGLEEKVILGFLGAVGTILTDYVAAIYLKMHARAAESLMDFHSRLVSTHTLFLANLIASRIDDKEKQWDTFAKLSLSMLGDKNQEPEK